MSVRGLRRFIHSATVAFDSGKTFELAARKWSDAVSTLARNVRSLARRFAQIPVSRGVDDIAMLGRIEGRRFTSMLRTGRSVRAFEGATGSVLSSLARQAFRRLDDVAELHFPDVSIMRRDGYVSRFRRTLVRNGVIRSGEKIADAAALERVIRADANTLARTNRLASKVSHTRRILYLGGAVVATGIGVAYLCTVATKHAAANTGCFVYSCDNAGVVRKCRALGCSCPVPTDVPKSDSGGGVGNVNASCRDDDLWSKMRLRETACGEGERAGRTAPFCVHCNWDESDPKSLDYVDKEAMPEATYVRCEKQDALDAMNEIIAATVDDAWNAGRSIGRVARDSATASLRMAPWVIGGVLLIVLLGVIALLWRTFGRSSSPGGKDDETTTTTYSVDGRRFL